MTDRIVRHIRKNLYGEIIALCNPEESWSPRQRNDAINDIENGIHNYYVPWGEIKILIKVKEGIEGKYLFAEHPKHGADLIEKLDLN